MLTKFGFPGLASAYLTAEAASDIVEQEEVVETLDLGHGMFHRIKQGANTIFLFASSIGPSALMAA